MIASSDIDRSSDGDRGALTRVLALESRNALARVELAASELLRFDANPAMRGMLETIQDAVEELDCLLGKVGLLWSVRGPSVRCEVEVDELLADVLARLRPSLQARGVVIESRPGVGTCCLEATKPALERLLLGFLRLALSATRSGSTLTLATRRGEAYVEFALADGEGDAGGQGWMLDPERRLGLELQLAECAGELRAASAPAAELCFRLPREADADAA